MQSRTITELHQEILQRQSLHILSLKQPSDRTQSQNEIVKDLNAYRTSKRFSLSSHNAVGETLKTLVNTGKLEKGKRARPRGWEFWYRPVCSTRGEIV